MCVELHEHTTGIEGGAALISNMESLLRTINRAVFTT